MSSDYTETELDFSPEATHQLFSQSIDIPDMNVGEARLRSETMLQFGYRAIGGVICGSARIDTAVRFHEKGLFHLANGALLGPYVHSDGQVFTGIMFYAPEVQ